MCVREIEREGERERKGEGGEGGRGRGGDGGERKGDRQYLMHHLLTGHLKE